MLQKTYQYAGRRRETMKSGNEIGHEVFSGEYAGSPTTFRIKLCVGRLRSPDRRGFMSKLIDAERQRHQSDDATEVAPKDNTLRLWRYYQKICQP